MHPKVNEYIKEKRTEELTFIRQLLLQTEVEEDFKWRSPIYTFAGKNIIGLAAFKNWTALFFHQGVFLSDPASVLINAQEGKTKALRQWRFKDLQEVEKLEDLIKEYIAEAIENAKAGKFHKPERSK